MFQTKTQSTESAAHWNHIFTIHVRVTVLIVLLHWASCAVTRLKSLGGFGAVWIKNKTLYSEIMGQVIWLSCQSLLPHYHALPWQLCTINVKLEFRSVLDGLHMTESICDWEHPISVPFSSVLIFLLVSLEVKPPEGLLATTSATTFASSLVGLLSCRMVMLQKPLLPSHQKSGSSATEQLQTMSSPAHPEKTQLKFSTAWALTDRGEVLYHDYEIFLITCS